MDYDVYLIVMRDGRTHAHVPALVGCNWRGATPEEALDRAPAAIEAHLAWLRRHDLPAPAEGEPVACRPVEQRSTVRGGGLVGFFESDRGPVAAGEVREFLHLMDCSRQDLLALTRDLPDEVLDWEPAPGSWSIRQILQHVANAERWYLARILASEDLPRLKRSRTVWERLEKVRALAVERLSGLSEIQRTATVVTDGEMWTARKVFRRFIEHEREHYAHAIQVLDARGLPRP